MQTIERQLAAYGDYLDELFEDAAEPEQVTVVRDPEGRPRRVLAAAAVALLAAVGATLVLRPPDDVVRSSSGPPVAWVPAEVPDGFDLRSASRGPQRLAGFAVYGPAGAGAGAPVVVVEAGPRGSLGDVEADDLTDVLVEAPGGDARVTSLRANTDVVQLLAGGLEVGPAPEFEVEVADLPEGWVELWDAGAVGEVGAASYSLAADDGERFDVTTWTGAPPGAEWGIRWPGRARAHRVAGAEAFADVFEADNPFVWWSPAPGVVVLVQNNAGDVVRATAFAESLRPAAGEAWDELASRATGTGPESAVATTTTITGVAVPSVLGGTVADAADLLRPLGLRGVVADTDADDGAATVVAQEPPPGAVAAQGSVVGLRTAAPAPSADVQCPRAVHPRFAARDGSADGLPAAGTTDLEAVRTRADRLRPELLARYPSAEKAYVAHRRGDVRSPTGDGGHRVDRADDYQVVVELGSADDCPDRPVSDGVPITFVLRRGGGG